VRKVFQKLQNFEIRYNGLDAGLLVDANYVHDRIALAGLRLILPEL
jgi:hypothetical protein